MNYNYEEVVWGRNTASLGFNSATSFRLENILKAARSVGGKPKILEIGCGAGQFIRAVKANIKDSDCFGVDISQFAIDKARSLNDGVSYGICSDKVPFEDETFDLVLVLDVLEHVEKPSEMVAEIKRVLKKDGLFFTFIPCEGDNTNFIYWLQKFGFLKGITKQCAGHINQYSVEKWLKTIEEEGFKKEKVRFSEHFIGQLLIVFTFIMLRAQAKKTPQSEVNNEDFYIKAYSSKWGKIFLVIRNVINVIINIESRIFSRVRSSNLHALFRK